MQSLGYLQLLLSAGMQVREVVAYAARRFIIVIPEIELPGHCGAALACYPHLSCRSLYILPLHRRLLIGLE